MTNDRRKFMAGALAGGLAATAMTACGSNDVVTAPLRPLLLLVHGSVHSSFCWARVTPYLVEAGYRVLAIDLPGTGLNKPVFPVSAFARPFVEASYATEATASAAVTLEDYRRSVADLVDRLSAANQGPIILVGHSLGGLTLNAVGESHATKLAGLIYLSALLPGNNQSALDVIPVLAAAGSYAALGNTGGVPADPAVIGVSRFDLNTPRGSANYAKMKAAYCADVSDQDFQAWLNLLVTDDAFGPYLTKIPLTAAKWGSLKRSYIKGTADNVVPVAAADTMIAAVDAFTPTNKTVVKSLTGASHSSFLSQPKELAALIGQLAG